MTTNIILSPSLLAVDFAHCGKNIAAVREGGAKYLHLDVMDGIFVPNISFGIPVIKSLRACTDMVFDTHLMIDRPERYIEAFASAGADIITVHYEATEHPMDVLRQIRLAGCRTGLAIKPKTDVKELYPYLHLCDLALVMTVEPGFGGQKFMADMLPKAEALRAYRKENGLNFEIEADGGIDETNVRACVSSGIEVLVAGSSVFGRSDPRLAAETLLEKANG